MGLIEVRDFSLRGWLEPDRAKERACWYCERMEEGNILFFAQTPFPLPEGDRSFLLNVRQTGSGSGSRPASGECGWKETPSDYALLFSVGHKLCSPISFSLSGSMASGFCKLSLNRGGGQGPSAPETQ